MLDNLLECFMAQPARLMAFGRSLVQAGGFLLVLGLVGRAATTSVSIARSSATQPLPSMSVADVLPGFLAWIVPEGAVGFSLAILLVAVGLASLHVGRDFSRRFGA